MSLRIRILMTSGLTAAVTLAGALTASAVDQPSDQPAGATVMAPKPTVEEELVRIRDMLAVQSMRLEQTEQLATRQAAQIEALQSELEKTRALVSASDTSLASTFGSSPFEQAATGERIHVVQFGETLYRIAVNNRVSVDRLARANNINEPEKIEVGQRIRIPSDGRPAAKPAGSGETAPPGAKIASAQQEQQTKPPAGPAPAPADTKAPTAVIDNRRRDAADPNAGLPEEVGVRPAEEKETPYLAALSDVGGILTPKGVFYVEPEIDYTTSADNRFFFQGTEIFDAILIGVIEATDTSRLALTERVGVRYGLTDRLEIDGKASFVHRDDRVTGVAVDDSTARIRNLNGSGFGDLEAGVHYQLNNGVKFPFAIANLRAKAPTGKGPFDVDRTPQGIETELASGSGFWTVEPSVTFILPTDPAVLFANIGYQVNLPTTPDAPIGSAIVREFDPGDAIRSSIGVGLSLNERLSLNFGYDQSYFFQTKSIIETADTANGGVILTDARQPTVTIGSLGIGGSYLVNDRLRLNLNTAFGATDAAPDMRISLRAQFRLFD
jgi:LysM repeat protein